jgi:hypothetical protein
MQLKPKKLGITQLFLSLFSLKLKDIKGTFRSAPSIPPATERSTVSVGVRVEVLDEN